MYCHQLSGLTDFATLRRALDSFNQEVMQYTGFRPLGSDEREPALELNRLLIRTPPATFFAIMQGDAMLRAGIRAGDLLIIEAAEQYQSGDIVLAFAAQQALVRRLRRSGTGYTLETSQRQTVTRALNSEDLIRGRVTAAITLLALPRVKFPVVQ